MSVITGEYKDFVSAEPIFSKVRRFLKSFSSTNSIDEGEFYEYVYDVLKEIGQYALKEEKAYLNVENYKTCLPEDFVSLYALYKCTPQIKSEKIKNFQGQIGVYYETEKTTHLAPKDCILNCDDCEPLDKWTITTYVDDNILTYNLKNPTLLSPGPNAGNICTADCANYNVSSPYEFTPNGRKLLFNFTDDGVLLLYYSMPKDDEGNPLIPDINQLHKAIEWYIIYQVTLGWWMNSEVPDIQSKWQKAEQEYYDALSNIKRLNKTPSFSRIINYMRNKRVINSVNAFSINDRKRTRF